MVAMIDYDKAEELINAHRGYGMVVLIDDELPAHGTVGDVTVCRFDTDPERLIEIMMDLENEREIAGKPLNLAIAVSKSREEEFGDDRDRHGWRLLRDATVYHVADRWTIKGLEMDEQARAEEAEEEEEDEPIDAVLIVETPSGLRQLDLDGYVKDEDDMWVAIDAYDEDNGTHFWDLIEPEMIVPGYVHVDLPLPDLTEEDFRCDDAEEEEEDEPTDVDIIVATYGEKALDAGYIVMETRNYRAEEIFEHFCATKDEARELAEDIWDRLSYNEKDRTTVKASVLAGFDIVDDIAIANHGATVWSSEFEGMIRRVCEDATSAIMHTVRDGVETRIEISEPCFLLLDMRQFLKQVREEAAEHPGKVSVEFFEEYQDSEGDWDCRIRLYEVD